MNISRFSEQVLVMHNRLKLLYHQVSTVPETPLHMTSAIMKEMGIAMEELQVALEEMHQQNDALAEALETTEVERKRYHDLFQFATDAYIVTDLDGAIQQSNRMAAQLLGIPSQLLIGKPLALHVWDSDRPAFEVELSRRKQFDSFQEWEFRLCLWSGKILHVACLVMMLRDRADQPVGLHWSVKDVTAYKRLKAISVNEQETGADELAVLHGRSMHQFSQGDLISLNSQTVWYVNRGIVKLSTLTEQGKEVLLGFLTPGMPFGSLLTSLSLYEALAVTDVELISIATSEIIASQHLGQFLFGRTSQRLCQTELLLAISGERQLEARLYRLLQLLKDQLGEPVEQGTCLSIRFTHEELANACCTTRVTISQLLSKLYKQGKIALDSRKHFILLDRF